MPTKTTVTLVQAPSPRRPTPRPAPGETVAETTRRPAESHEAAKAYGRWIPVDEALPDNSRRVLVCAGGCVVFACYLNEAEWEATGRFVRGGGWDTTYGPVTHWMSLPEPPPSEDRF